MAGLNCVRFVLRLLSDFSMKFGPHLANAVHAPDPLFFPFPNFPRVHFYISIIFALTKCILAKLTFQYCWLHLLQ